ncbi:nucleoside hydrolase [Anabaena sp. UHCC 0253]|uniref:nucleoside hydrolase n=1 Tax=Anabaena sp. UHCC 0253 TaxID=2590019 RepID=UPI001446F7A3|nr:nucleoside hydrolase [Anabaena sp. UHCC 0253]MTJ55939.1 nucleoside hydrolase [Anabaena sp. UHCC 0253]
MRFPWRNKADLLPGINLPFTQLKSIATPAPEYLIETVSQYSEQITLLCLGPLTNIALAIEKGGEDFVKGVKQIVMMGGAVRVSGNGTPNQVSEWNLYVDPLAASQTFKSGIPITMIGLDVTNLAPCTPELNEKLGNLSSQNEVGKIM